MAFQLPAEFLIVLLCVYRSIKKYDRLVIYDSEELSGGRSALAVNHALHGLWLMASVDASGSFILSTILSDLPFDLRLYAVRIRIGPRNGYMSSGLAYSLPSNSFAFSRPQNPSCKSAK